MVLTLFCCLGLLLDALEQISNIGQKFISASFSLSFFFFLFVIKLFYQVLYLFICLGRILNLRRIAGLDLALASLTLLVHQRLQHVDQSCWTAWALSRSVQGSRSAQLWRFAGGHQSFGKVGDVAHRLRSVFVRF